jgi:hypothetical protein
MSDTPDLAAVVQELAAARAELASTVHLIRHRQAVFAALSVVTIVFLVFYLGYAYHRFGGEVTPDLVAYQIQAGIVDALPDTRLQLEKNLKEDAPRQVQDAFDQLQSLPGKYTDQLQRAATDRIDAAMPGVQEQIYQSMRVALDQATKQTAAAGGDKPGTDDEARLEATLKAVSDVYATETLKFVDQQHATYAADALAFTDYLDRLATAPMLDHRDQLHRDMFRTVFALVNDRAARGGLDGTAGITTVGLTP